MFAIPLTSGRSTALASSIVAVALLALLNPPVAETPAPPQPRIEPVQLSASGKVVDRLPGNASRAALFGEPGDQAPAPMALSGTAFLRAFSTATDFATAYQPAMQKPEPVLEARAAAPTKTAHATARSQKAVTVAAALPPPRPASLREPAPAAAIAVAPPRSASVASRMIAFVGSLASLARPL